jgi:hypothetical protein
MLQNTEPQERPLRRNEAAAFIRENFNLPCSPRTLAKLACVGGGPPFHTGRFPLYPVAGLREWAEAKIGPLVKSTSEVTASTNAAAPAGA